MNNGMGNPVNTTGLIRLSVVASHPKYLHPISTHQIRVMCRSGVFKTAVKLGMGRTSAWWVSSGEVLAYRLKRTATAMMNQY
jgi:hypothetical protein